MITSSPGVAEGCILDRREGIYAIERQEAIVRRYPRPGYRYRPNDIEFNWLDQSVEVLIEMILSPFDYALAESVIKRMEFRRKLDVLRDLIKVLPDHLTSQLAERRYKRFVHEMNGLIKQADDLNKFRNTVIHFRPVNGPTDGKVDVLSATAEIKAKAYEMSELGRSFFPKAINLRDDNSIITFVGNHDLLTENWGADELICRNSPNFLNPFTNKAEKEN